MVCGKEASTGRDNCHISQSDCAAEIPLEVQKCCTVFTRPPSPLGGLKGGLGMRLGGLQIMVV